jgi:hypothetical protein
VPLGAMLACTAGGRLRSGTTWGDLQNLEAILEAATGISATASAGGGVLTPRGDPYLPSVTVKFPGERVVAFDRVDMWVDGDHVRLAMCCRALKLSTIPSLSMHTKHRVVRRRDDGVLDMMPPTPPVLGNDRH